MGSMTATRRPANTNEGTPWGTQTRTPPVSCGFVSSLDSVACWCHAADKGPAVLPKLAYLTLGRSVQLLALLARGDAAKDLRSWCCAARFPTQAHTH
jgi:hypothetical protein